MTFFPDPQDTWQGPRVKVRNLSAFKIIGAIGAECRAKGGALFHIRILIKLSKTNIYKYFGNRKWA